MSSIDRGCTACGAGIAEQVDQHDDLFRCTSCDALLRPRENEVRGRLLLIAATVLIATATLVISLGFPPSFSIMLGFGASMPVLVVLEWHDKRSLHVVGGT